MDASFTVDGIGPLRPVPDPPGPRRRAADGVQDGPAFASELAGARSAAGPAGPPPEVGDEVRAAARAAANLHDLGRELRFERGDDGSLRVELRDLKGNVLRTVAPTEVLDFAAGKVTS